jgi:hypothetical protein
MQMERMKSKENISATQVVASTLAVLVGLAGIDHGIFEILQGNVAPNGVMIEAIGPAQRFWEYGTETALTIVPNLLISGFLSVLIGLLVIVWAVAFVDKKHGVEILTLLSILLFLVGGGFAPVFMAILASLTATRINKPLTWWRKDLLGGVGNFLAKIWPRSLIAFVLLFLISVEIAIFGWPLTLLFGADIAFDILNTLAYVMLGLMLLSILTGFAYDIQQHDEMASKLMDNLSNLETRS